MAPEVPVAGDPVTKVLNNGKGKDGVGIIQPGPDHFGVELDGLGDQVLGLGPTGKVGITVTSLFTV